MLNLYVNGDSMQFDGDLTIADLLENLSVSSPAIAVEVNKTLVTRSFHPSHQLHEGDRVEIVTFVGGG